MRRLALFFVGLLANACAFTVPSAPTVSGRNVANKMVSPSPAAEQMGRAAAGDIQLQQVIYDEACRCENRLSALVSKMKDERAGRGALTLAGGGIGAVGALSAALLEDKDAKTASAIVAAVGSLLAIGSQLVGEPATEMELYQRALRRYEAARATSVTCTGTTCLTSIRQSLALCSDENTALPTSS